MVMQAASELPLMAAKVAMDLCKELGNGKDEFQQALKPVFQCLDQNRGREALTPAVKVLSDVFRQRVEETLKVNPILPLTARQMSKDCAGRGGWVAKVALNIFKESSDREGEAYAQLLAAFAHVEKRDAAKALKAAAASEACFKELRNRLGEAASLHAASSARLVRAMAPNSHQLQLVEDKEDKIKAVKARRDVEIKQGMDVAREACSIYNDLDEKKLEANCLNTVANLLLAKDEPDDAKNVARESRDICQDIEDIDGEARALGIIVSANMLHQGDFVDALFAAKDTLWLYRNSDVEPEDEDKMAIANALHAIANVHLAVWELSEARETAEEAVKLYDEVCSTNFEKLHGLAPALQTLAHALSADQKPDDALPHSERAVEICAASCDRNAEGMAKAMLAYQDQMARLKIWDEKPHEVLDEWSTRIQEENWKLAEEAFLLMQELRNEEGEAQVQSMIDEMNKAVEKIQAKSGTPTRTVWTIDKNTRKAVRKDYYDTPKEEKKKNESAKQDEEEEMAAIEEAPAEITG
eukprot:TRINITY_DN91987_c0_g1_i1.p1 TRINITY_DN91987_c0_g1~~TRINITY_DN91987_c0_g1_i1.p1  ORF type:complete len:526 (-),score=150.14 TRINITY_DN91987_c0_g1_i1:155-1732(-)